MMAVAECFTLKLLDKELVYGGGTPYTPVYGRGDPLHPGVWWGDPLHPGV